MSWEFQIVEFSLTRKRRVFRGPDILERFKYFVIRSDIFFEDLRKENLASGD